MKLRIPFYCLITTILLLLLSHISFARKDTGMPPSDTAIKAYFTILRAQRHEEPVTIVLQKQLMEIVHEDYQYAGQHTFTFMVTRLVQINELSDIDELTEISLPFSSDLKVKNVNAITYNMENDQLTTSPVGRSDMLKEKLSKKGLKILKFNFPSVKKGSLLFYTFSYSFDVGAGIPFETLPVVVQEKYPIMDYYFELTIPRNSGFIQHNQNISFRNCASLEELYRDSSGIWMSKDADSKHYVWHRHNVPAFEKEELVSNNDDHREKLTLYDYPTAHPDSMVIPLSTLTKKDSKLYPFDFNSPHWNDIYGDTLKNTIKNILNHPEDLLDSARQLYVYVRDSIKIVDQYGPAAQRLPSMVLKNKKGTYAEKNSLLFALLQQCGFTAYPVVLATIDQGRVDPLFFDRRKLNYLIVATTINHKAYLLDASLKMLSFGLLNPECYNGFSWMLARENTSINISPDLMPNKSLCSVAIEPTDSAGKFLMKMMERTEGYAAYYLRRQLQSDSTAYETMIRKRMNNWSFPSRLDSISIANKNNPDTPLICTTVFNIEIGGTNDLVYFNPLLKKFFESNPLDKRQKERKYDIELGAPYDFTYLLKMKLPPGLAVEDATPSQQLDFDGHAMQYKASVLNNGQGEFYLSVRFQAEKTQYPAHRYDAIYDFFEKVTEEQNKKVVLKRTDHQNR